MRAFLFRCLESGVVASSEALRFVPAEQLAFSELQVTAQTDNSLSVAAGAMLLDNSCVKTLLRVTDTVVAASWGHLRVGLAWPRYGA